MEQMFDLANLDEFRDHPIRILIVDDDAHHRALEKDLLDASIYRVDEAASGPEALAKLGCADYDVVLLDKRMPEMDGDETCRRIRRDRKLRLLPVLMVTGNSDTDNLTQSMRAGATDFVRKPYDPSELLARVHSAASRKRQTDQLDSAESLLFALARMVEAKDGTTGDHCSRLSHTGVVLGQAMGLANAELGALRRGGILHDVGKLGIPDSILLKPGALTEQEWVLMRQHVNIGAQIVGELQSMRLTVPIVLHHHERWDGSGYPHGLKGQDIPLLARVFQTVDIYDALTHARPYKPAMRQEEVITVMEQEASRGWRDPEVTAVMLDIVRTRPQALVAPEGSPHELGADLFEMIHNTGVIDWCRKDLQ
jgi:putative two-component system response regulator